MDLKNCSAAEKREVEKAKNLVERMVKALMAGVAGLIRVAGDEQETREVTAVARMMEDVMSEVRDVLGFGGAQ